MPKVDISTLSESEQASLVENRWQESSSLWEIVDKTFRANKKIWENTPDWLANIPKNRSKARVNKTFRAMESIITTLTGRPTRPNTIPANDTEESVRIANDLQEFFLAKYRDLGIKAKFRRGLRYLFLAKLFSLKIFWDPATDDFDVLPVDPRNIRLSKKATSMYDTEFAIELVPDIPIAKIIELFPEKETEILKKAGIDKKRLLIDNPMDEYREAWIDDYKLCEFRGIMLDVQLHPYWDFDGLKVTNVELAEFNQASGRKRRPLGRALETSTEERKKKGGRYQTYLYNHFDRPIPPFIFGTVLAVDNKPVGDTSLIEQAEPLQNEIDKRKRQISDNAELMNGKWKVDTSIAKMSKAEAQQMTTNPRGVIYGPGVRLGVEIVTGKELPSFIKDDLNHSTIELDNIMGTQPTFRGTGEGKEETATGRAILREQSFSQLDELIDLVDTLHHQLYAWMFQMMKVRYTESHYVKPIGAVNAREVIDLTRNDLEEGIELQVIPGQIMPEDKVFKMERAKEEAIAGLIDPLTYFEESGRENPMKLAKRLEMYKINPFSIVKLDDEDKQAILEAAQFFAGQGQQGTGGGQTGGGQDPRAAEIAKIRSDAEQEMNSPEFAKLSKEEQAAKIDVFKQRVEALANTK